MKFDIKRILRSELPPIILYHPPHQTIDFIPNIEHIIPISKIKNFPNEKKRCKNDLHLLFLANPLINSFRGNRPFTFSLLTEKEKSFCKANDLVNDKSFNKSFHPPNDSKGIIARSLIYFQQEYQMSIRFVFSDSEEELWKWNHLYPPSENELIRNDLIRFLQKRK